MQITHSAVASPIFKQAAVYEFDVVFGDETYPINIELYQDVNDSKRFRCRVMQAELLLVKVFVFVESDNAIEVVECTKTILVDWSTNLSGDYDDFFAEHIDVAMTIVSEDIRNYLVRVTDTKN